MAENDKQEVDSKSSSDPKENTIGKIQSNHRQEFNPCRLYGYSRHIKSIRNYGKSFCKTRGVQI